VKRSEGEQSSLKQMFQKQKKETTTKEKGQQQTVYKIQQKMVFLNTSTSEATTGYDDGL